MMNNYIYEYYQCIQDGSVIVSQWIRLFYKKIIDGLQNQEYFYDPKKARRAITFIETFVHHTKGRCDRLKLELWQKAMLSVIFGIVDDSGARQFREIFIVVARKNGKSLLASAILTYSVFCDGEYGADAICVAPKLDQADFVYSTFVTNVQLEPELAARGKSRKSDFFIAESNSSVKKIAFNAKKSDGFNPHCAVLDELASWPATQGLKQYEVVKSSFGSRRQPLMVSVGTAGYENEGPYDEVFKRSTRMIKGDSREKRLAAFLYTIDDPSKWSDINELQKANPNLGVSVSVDYLLEEVAIAEGSFSKKAEFLTKYCNIKQNSSQAWLTSQTVERASGSALDLNDFRGCYCVGGIDLSRTSDLTACCVVIEKDGRLHVFTQFFLPSERIDDASIKDGVPYRAFVQRGILKMSGENYVDYRDCYDWFKTLIEQYKIYPLKIGYDRYTAQYLVQDLKNYGFHTDDVNQGFNLTPVIRETQGLLQDGVFDIGDNDLLKIHLLDSALKHDADNDKVKLVKISTTAHIDGAAALLDAMTVRQKWYGEIGRQLKNDKKRRQ